MTISERILALVPDAPERATAKEIAAKIGLPPITVSWYLGDCWRKGLLDRWQPEGRQDNRYFYSRNPDAPAPTISRGQRGARRLRFNARLIRDRAIVQRYKAERSLSRVAKEFRLSTARVHLIVRERAPHIMRAPSTSPPPR